MRRTGLALTYLVALAITLGGVGDLTIRHLLGVHIRYLTSGGVSSISPETSSLVLHLVHALGGGLVAVGVAALALVHFGLRRGQRWAGFTALTAIVSSEGSNAIGMYAVGSYWYVSVTYVVIAAVGIALTLSSPELRTAARP
jgi:hypothetical protein